MAMVNPHKILTVSYGTFSCTLEGFDDSFGTMKAIAEYFRDLASDDRYFGAEPPTPDADMLARIAEKEIARRVEAHLDDKNIVLKADPGTILPVAATSPAPSSEHVVAEEQPATTVQQETVQQESAPADAENPENTAQDPAFDADEAAQPKAQPKALSTTPTAEVSDPQATTEAIANPDDAPDDAADANVTAGSPEDMVSSDSGFETELTRALVADTLAGALADAMHDEGDAEQHLHETPAASPETGAEIGETPSPKVDILDDRSSAGKTDADRISDQIPDPDSVAAKLQRIRSVVDVDEPDTDYSEDEHADDFLSEARQDITAALNADDSLETRFSGQDAGNVTDDDPISAMLGELEIKPAKAPEPEQVNRLDGLEAAPEPLAEPRAEPKAPTAPEATAKPVARVVRMKRSEYEAALTDGEFEEVKRDTGSAQAEAETTLSPEDEADLLRELAAVEAEFRKSTGDSSTGLDEGQAEDTIAAATERDDGENLFAEGGTTEPGAVAAGSRRARLAAADTDGEMGRILAETEQHMDEESGKGRRQAIAHLRAAVAATKAEQGVGGNLNRTDPEDDAYRSDLADVVRPRRATGSARTQRPGASRPAPLKLVAEQRVDLNESPKGPVRPRRVAADANAAAQSADNFAEYAENVGADSLPELLEAAASYLAFVEGHDMFSRPQLMTKVRQVEQDEFSREEGLRFFGQLLREGKIVKVKAGRFGVSDDIAYRPDARAAGA